TEEGVQHTSPSERRPEMLPEVPSTRPSASMRLAAASTASRVVVGEVLVSATLEDLRVGQVGGHLAAQQRGEPLGDEGGVVRLGVVGGPADVRGEEHVGHADQRVVEGQGLALEVIEGGGGEVAR